jgi:4-aminobutyrate aminotransferase-like enzyme
MPTALAEPWVFVFNISMNEHDLVDRSTIALSNVLGHATQLQIKHGKGAYLTDYNNKDYLDFGAGIAVNSTGHCHPHVVSAIQAQSSTLLHACAGVVYYDQNITLAEKLGAIAGGDLNSVFFTQSGTEAVEAALKCAVYVKNKPNIVTFNGSFHGRTLGALSVTTSNPNYLKRYPSAFPNRVVLEYPYFLKNQAPLSTEAGYLEYLSDALNALDTSTIAAVIIEPFMGEGGYVPCPGSVLSLLRSWCSQHDVFLIFDEIQSGIARTGEWFYFQHCGVTPDILTSAKGIASGLPLGACIATKAIMDQWQTGSHGGTYGGNPLSCAAGIATLEVLTPLHQHIATLGDMALHYCKAELAHHPLVGDIRGKGLMIGLEFITTKGEPNADAVSAILSDCLTHHVLVLSCGIHRNVIRLMPPLTISKDELMTGLRVLVDACHRAL